LLSSCCLHVVYMLCTCFYIFHVDYMLFTCCLHVVYMLFTCCLHVVYMLITCCFYVDYMLLTCWLHVVYMFFTFFMLITCCLHVVYMLITCCFTCCLHVVYMFLHVVYCCLHVGYMLTTCCLHLVYMLITCCLHVGYMLFTCWLHVFHAVHMLTTCCVHVFTFFMLFTCCVHVIYMLFTCCLHVVYMLFACCLHVVYMLFTCCLHVAYMLFTCCLHVVCMLFTCCLHIAYMYIKTSGWLGCTKIHCPNLPRRSRRSHKEIAGHPNPKSSPATLSWEDPNTFTIWFHYHSLLFRAACCNCPTWFTAEKVTTSPWHSVNTQKSHQEGKRHIRDRKKPPPRHVLAVMLLTHSRSFAHSDGFEEHKSKYKDYWEQILMAWLCYATYVLSVSSFPWPNLTLLVKPHFLIDQFWLVI
jgi:hypothetical protein